MANNIYDNVKVGDHIRIIKMDDANGKDPAVYKYADREGEVTLIDDAGQLHGTWGNLAVIPELDVFVKINTDDFDDEKEDEYDDYENE